MQAVVVADGVRYDVAADLRREPSAPVDTTAFTSGRERQRGLPDAWSGTLTAEDANAAWKIYEDEDRRLLLGNGEERTFTVTKYQGESTELVIRGNGAVPF